jgi:ABC-type lipoprotein export system ATPase subunit
VMVTHDPALAAHADRIITLRDGLVVSDVMKDVKTEAGANACSTTVSRN